MTASSCSYAVTNKASTDIPEIICFNVEDDYEFFEFFSQVMGNCRTGLERISAVLPSGSLFIHKTGTGFQDSEGKEDRNDAGIIFFPDGSQITIAVFVQAAQTESDVADIAAEYLWQEK